ncbi:MAG TPA: uridine diphosphate-N-acetylglucosamine-binding protein YvcK [Candidatus Woesebacteria bacterium]|nr:uridine diphosphate-N-acetylglucosamine-binding protein YvcK [Candidatus Woesebacteria bacterium]
MPKKKIVVIGGGTGTAVVLSGLKQYPDLEITAIVVVTDNGGSTGRLRDEFGFLPAGDLRQCLAALATGENESLIRDILLYRFSKQSSLAGHNLGNLILTALEDLARERKDSPARAIEIASQVFETAGRVYPISEHPADLVIDYQDKQIIGEKNLDNPKLGGQKIKKISLKEKQRIYHRAAQAIKEADLIILGPGDLYASLLANTLVDGFAEAMHNNQKRGGKFVYVLNLMTHFSQTHQMTAFDHLSEVNKYCQRQPDYVLINSEKISPKILEHYASQNEWPVIDDLNQAKKNQQSVIDWSKLNVKRHHLLSTVLVSHEPGHSHSLLRHDKNKLAQSLIKILKNS